MSQPSEYNRDDAPEWVSIDGRRYLRGTGPAGLAAFRSLFPVRRVALWPGCGCFTCSEVTA